MLTHCSFTMSENNYILLFLYMSSSALDHAGVKYRRCETGAEREREKRGKGEGQRERERNVHKLHV